MSPANESATKTVAEWILPVAPKAELWMSRSKDWQESGGGPEWNSGVSPGHSETDVSQEGEKVSQEEARFLTSVSLAQGIELGPGKDKDRRQRLGRSVLRHKHEDLSWDSKH